MSKKPNNVYYLQFNVTNDTIVPKNKDEFFVMSSDNSKYGKIYVYKNSNFSNKTYVKTLDIDRFTTQFPCQEALIDSLFQNYDANQKFPGIVPEIKLLKYKEFNGKQECVSTHFLQVMYEDEWIIPMLDVLEQYNRETFYSDTNEFLEYWEYITTLISDKKFYDALVNGNYIGKKMKESLQNYNGTYDSLYQFKQYLKNYHALRGVHVLARKFDPVLIEEQNKKEELWKYYKEQKETDVDNNMTYFETLRYTGKIRELKDSISNGQLDLDTLPFNDDSFAEHVQSILKKYHFSVSNNEREYYYKLLLQLFSTPLLKKEEPRFSELKEIVLHHPEQLDRYPTDNITIKGKLKNMISCLKSEQNEMDKSMRLDEIMAMIEIETTPCEETRHYNL